MKIAVIGSTMMDVVSYVDKIPEAGETRAVREFHTAGGGKGANQAMAASKLGANVLFVTCVGDDTFGEACMKNSGCVKVVTDKLILKGFSAKTAKNTAETICQYEFDYIAGGVVSILNNWMRNGRRENAKQMTTITSNCIKSLNPDGNYPYSVATAQEFLL